MFEAEKIAAVRAFYETRERWREILNYRSIGISPGTISNIFFGDSLTEAWPLHEFFPGYSLLNRGIGGDSVYGLYDRMEKDVFVYHPQRVFMLIGINGIEEDKYRIIAHIKALATMLKERGISVFISSLLPIRYPDNWNRFQYQDKIVEINAELREWAASGNADGFIDYHHAVKDGSGQLAAAFAQPDGTHLTFEAYRRMSELVAPYLL